MGGVKDTEQKALTVDPTGAPPRQVVTIVTPVGKYPMAERHSAGVGPPG